ncbi:MAG: ATP-dependent helicase, partial [Acidobacteriota bacterium]
MARKFVLPQRARAALSIDFDRELNEQQRAVVTCGDGPKLVIAGAGSGKTRTLTYRVAWLLQQGVAPGAVLLVTFTNKAAREMLGRVGQLTQLEPHRLWGGTFHSVGARLLRRHAQLLGYNENFSILDEADQRDLLRVCTTDLDIQVEQKRFPSPRVLAGLFSLQMNTREPLEDLIMERYPRFIEWTETIEEIAKRYRQRKRAANAMDYDDLLQRWLDLLNEYEDIRRRYREQFAHVLVDEYQDTNIVQAEIVEGLAGGSQAGNLMVVGDDSQSIYAFRGANYDNILRFPERNPGTEVFKLETNYRSTPQILALTNASIRGNTDQYDKTLRARRGEGMLPALVPGSYPEQEAAFVAERILQLRDEGVELSDIAVLYRAHAHRLSVETTLLRYDIPYEVRGGLRFFEQAHIKDVVAHLRILENPRDEVAFRRVMLLQPGIGNVTAERVWRTAGAAELVARLRSTEVRNVLSAKARPAWDGFVDTMGAALEAQSDPEVAIRSVLEACYEDYAVAKFDNAESRIEDLQQLAVFAAQYDSVHALLEELLLLGELYGQEVAGGAGGDDGDSSVVLSTIHQAKGLEWHAVFLIHLIEGFFPSPRALDETGGEEEERRIFYVAMTRARDELYLSYPIIRPGGYGASVVQQPSRFLQELPEQLYETWQLEEEPIEGLAATDPAGRYDRPSAAPEYDPNVDPVWDDDEPIVEPWDDD